MKKDLQSFFWNPLFYLVAFICALLLSPLYIYIFGVFLTQLLSPMGVEGEYQSYQLRVASEFVTLTNFILLLVVNSLTMKLISEEKKSSTFSLLLTSPLTSWQIVIAKYLSGLIVTSAFVILSFLYPLTTSFLGKVQWGPLLVSYFGLFLLAAIYVGLGLFSSSLTRSVLVSFVLALILNLSLWFFGIGSEISESPRWRAFFGYINLETIFKDFSLGIVRLPAIFFILSLIVFSLIATEKIIESQRWRS